jgi:hypothetical protein
MTQDTSGARHKFVAQSVSSVGPQESYPLPCGPEFARPNLGLLALFRGVLLCVAVRV